MTEHSLRQEDLQFIKNAADYLENPSFIMKAVNTVGKPVEWVSGALPEDFHQTVQKSLVKAMELISKTIGDEEGSENDLGRLAGWRHTAATAVSGAVGGLFGIPALAVELPITTAIMLRSIASIAHESGENVRLAETHLECLMVLSHGGPSPDDDAMESTYYTTRLGAAMSLREVARYLSKVTSEQMAQDIARGAAPRLVQFLARVGSRFGVVVSQKAVAQAIPLLGAGAGAAVNVAFSDHFNQIARFHFGLRKLERQYGQEKVQEAYESALRGLRSSRAEGKELNASNG